MRKKLLVAVALSAQVASNKASGTRVVLPEPGGACSSAMELCSRVVFNSGRMESTGSMTAHYSGR